MSVRRIIDANANRAREALRVMEEAARFLLDDAELTGSFKRLRHALASVLADVPALADLATDRDTPRDVGTTISTPTERQRRGTPEVVVAAGKRLSEALRVIEEYGKTLDERLAARVESLRYEAYELDRRLVIAAGRTSAPQWTVCVLFGESVCGERSWSDVLDRVLTAEPDAIQLREKDLDDRVLLDRARTVVERAGPATRVIVNDRPDVAILAGADGVHLGQDDLPCADVRRFVPPGMLIGVSTSGLDEARAARRDGADYCGVGPMFPSATKAKDVIVGPAYLDAYVAWGGLPHLAIGGITPDNVEQLTAVGGRGVAVSAAVCLAHDPAAVVRELRARLEAPAPAPNA